MNSDIYANTFIAMLILLISSIVVPLFSGKRKLSGWLNFLMTAAAGIILLSVSYTTIFIDGNHTTKLIQVGSLNFYFLIDGISALFLGIISFMSIISAFYSVEYMDHYKEYKLRSYYFFFPIFILGMIGIVTVDDLSIGFGISWQLMTVASYFLIKFENKIKDNVRNANKYLILMELAWCLIVAGTLFINNIAIGDSLHSITAKIATASGITPYIIYGLILLGFGFKAGVFPLGQLWLPDAHSIAPSPVSALLSGVMIKTGIYGIIRTVFWMVPHAEGFHFDGILWGGIISTVGVVTLFIGTVQSMKQNDAKRLLAYSSIGQIGYIVFGIGASLFMFNVQSDFIKLLSLVAIIGVIYHILNHAIFKGLLFLSSGSVLYATGTKDLNKLGGLLKLMPISGVIAGIASLSISGVPPFSGFVSKWTIISSSILAGSEIMFLVIFGIIALFTSTITLSCYVKFFGMTYTSSGSEWNTGKEIKEVPVSMLVPKIILTILCIVQGLLPFVYYQTIVKIFQVSQGSFIHNAFNDLKLDNHVFSSMMGVQVSVPGVEGIISSVAVPVVVLIVFSLAMLFAWLLKRSGGSQERTADTWLCGYQDLQNNNRFKNKNMFAVLKKALWWTGGNVKE